MIPKQSVKRIKNQKRETTKKIIYSAGGFAANLKSSQGMILHQPITRKAKKIQKIFQ